MLASDLNRAILSHQASTVHIEQDVYIATCHPLQRRGRMGLSSSPCALSDQCIRLLQGGQEKSPLERLMRQLVGDGYMCIVCTSVVCSMPWNAVKPAYTDSLPAIAGCDPAGAAPHEPPSSGSR